MDIIEDTLTLQMEGRGVQLKAEVDVDIPFTMWLATGTNWKFLGAGCFIDPTFGYPCWGALIHFRTKIELDILFDINWNEDTNKILVNVNMQDTKLK